MRLHREVVDGPFLEMFKALVDEPLSNAVWWKVVLLMAGMLELGDIWGPFHTKAFYDYMIGF